MTDTLDIVRIRQMSPLLDPQERAKLVAVVPQIGPAMTFETADRDDAQRLIREAMVNRKLEPAAAAELQAIRANPSLAPLVNEGIEALDMFGIDTSSMSQPATANALVPLANPKASGGLRVTTFDASRLPQPQALRRVVLPGVMRGIVSVLAGAPGAGKSNLAAQIAVAVCFEDSGLLGAPVEHAGPVVYVSAEDDVPEFERRLAGIHRGFSLNMPPTAQTHALHVVGGPIALVERPDRGVPPKETSAAQSLVELIDQVRPAVVIIDTLAAVVRGVDENDGGDMTAVMSVMSKIAQDFGCAVVLLHHTAKAAAGRAGDQNAVRGSSAIVGSARSVMTLAGLSEEEGEKLGLTPLQVRGWVRLDMAKANYSASGHTRWFERQEIMIPAIDPETPGILASETAPVLLPRASGPAAATSPEIKKNALEIIAAAVARGDPLRSHANGGDRSAVVALSSGLDMDRKIAAALLKELKHQGLVTEVKQKVGGKDRSVIVPVEKNSSEGQ